MYTFQPAHTSHLSITATFSCPEGDHCKQVAQTSRVEEACVQQDFLSFMDQWDSYLMTQHLCDNCLFYPVVVMVLPWYFLSN